MAKPTIPTLPFAPRSSVTAVSYGSAPSTPRTHQAASPRPMCHRLADAGDEHVVLPADELDLRERLTPDAVGR